MKTFIKWAGNKSKYIKHIQEYIPEFVGTYIEPFVGSGAVFLKLQPNKWIINDLNKDLINIWKLVRDDPEYIIKNFKEFSNIFKPKSVTKKREICKKIVDGLNNEPFTNKRSIAYLLSKFFSYMGHILVKNVFKFRGLELNIYNNKYSFLSLKYYTLLKDTSRFLNKSKGYIFNQDYTIVLNKAKAGDFVFLDPPYFEQTSYQFNYNKNEIVDEDFLKNLLSQLEKLDKKKVKWLMTQADTKIVRNIFKKYTIKTFEVYRIASKSYKTELLIMNYKLP